MRVLVISSFPPRACGIGAYARDQVARLRGEGHQVTVLSPPDGGGDARVPFLGGRPFLRAVRIGRRFDRIVVHFQPALYYRPRAPVSRVLTSLGLLWLALRRRSRLDVLVHEADRPNLWRPDYALLRLAFETAGRVSFHTERQREELQREYRVRVRSAIVPHRVEAVTHVSRREARRLLGVEDEDGPLFVCAGFLHPAKGFDRAIDAVAATAANGAAPRLVIVGSVRDPTEENVAYARDLDARSRRVPGVTLLERFVPDEEFDLWVTAADWLVLPYRRSWSSGVLARAQALGTPSIVAAVGGLPEQAGPADLVFADDPGLVRAFEEAIARRGTGDDDERASPQQTARRMGDRRPIRSDWDPEAEAPPSRKRGNRMLIGLILISVALAALAQLTLKHGMNQVTSQGDVPLALSEPLETIRRIVLNVSVWAGLLTFVASASVWLVVLSRASLSFAYPFASLTYVLILLFDRFVLHQPVSGIRYAGVALIIAGLLLISRTHQGA